MNEISEILDKIAHRMETNTHIMWMFYDPDLRIICRKCSNTWMINKCEGVEFLYDYLPGHEFEFLQTLAQMYPTIAKKLADPHNKVG